MSFETPGPVETDLSAVISPIEDIIADAKAGRMFILVDHEDRENEGDLVILPTLPMRMRSTLWPRMVAD